MRVLGTGDAEISAAYLAALELEGIRLEYLSR
jgi:hypothetical protein